MIENVAYTRRVERLTSMLWFCFCAGRMIGRAHPRAPVQEDEEDVARRVCQATATRFLQGGA